MLSRETKVQAGAAAVGLVVLGVGATRLDLSVWWTQPLLVGLFEAIVFGGGHLYFVLRGGGGSVSLTARRRFLWLILAFLTLVPLVVLAGERTLGPLGVRRVLMWALGGITVVYLFLEGIAGYRATMAED